LRFPGALSAAGKALFVYETNNENIGRVGPGGKTVATVKQQEVNSAFGRRHAIKSAKENTELNGFLPVRRSKTAANPFNPGVLKGCPSWRMDDLRCEGKRVQGDGHESQSRAVAHGGSQMPQLSDDLKFFYTDARADWIKSQTGPVLCG